MYQGGGVTDVGLSPTNTVFFLTPPLNWVRLKFTQSIFCLVIWIIPFPVIIVAWKVQGGGQRRGQPGIFRINWTLDTYLDQQIGIRGLPERQQKMGKNKKHVTYVLKHKNCNCCFTVILVVTTTSQLGYWCSQMSAVWKTRAFGKSLMQNK